MSIQSLSIMVPCGGHCINNCKFCVSRMRDDEAIFGKEIINANNIPDNYINRIKYVRDAGCDNIIFTGTTEPQQNLPFIYALLKKNFELPKPFYNIAIQTTGTNLIYEDIKNLADNGITTLALSVSAFLPEHNWEIIQTPEAARKMTVDKLIAAAKECGMNVRVCLNMTDAFSFYSFDYIIQWAKYLNVDQITFRKIYNSNTDSEQDKWIAQHKYSTGNLLKIESLVKEKGTPIRILPFGATLYDCDGLGIVIDNDCMAKHNINEMRYAILRPNNKLYSSWDLKGSLIY